MNSYGSLLGSVQIQRGVGTSTNGDLRLRRHYGPRSAAAPADAQSGAVGQLLHAT